MNNLYCVRADFGKYADEFLKGGYAAIGWLPDDDLSKVTHKDEIYTLYKRAYPEHTSMVVGIQVGQISRFLHDLQEGDYVILPDRDTNLLHYGTVAHNSYYYASQNTGDHCPYRHRKSIEWEKVPVMRNQFSVPFQNTMRSSLTVFAVNHKRNFFECIGRKDLLPKETQNITVGYYQSVLNKILELDDKEFEILVTHILSAVGFEGSECTGRVGDGGVDAIGELDVYGMAKIKIFVQAKRYKLGAKIRPNVVKALRANIPQNGQGAFITTADFPKKAFEVANAVGFPRIGLINGEQLVDILTDIWEEIPEEFRHKLGLKVGLIPS